MSKIPINSDTFAKNGGGLYVHVAGSLDYTTPMFTDCAITGNTAANNGGGVNRSHQRTGTGLIHPTDKGIASVMGLLFVAQIFHISNTPLLSSCTRGRRRRGAPFR